MDAALVLVLIAVLLVVFGIAIEAARLLLIVAVVLLVLAAVSHSRR